MASKFQRRCTWWVKFQHPLTGELVRESLGTRDPARAELLRERVELEHSLLAPRFQAADLPENVRRALGARQGDHARFASTPASASVAPSCLPATPSGPPVAPPAERVVLDEALAAYLNFVRSENAPRHVENKISMLRRFIGTQRAEKFAQAENSKLRVRRLSTPCPPFFTGIHLDEITPALLQEFVEQLGVSTKTKRHYREFFHHFFQFCINFGLYRPENFHCPNPTAALPSFLSKNRRIVFLSDAEVDAQLAALESHPAFRIAAALMIYAGLRRSEALWLTRDALAPDLSFLSVVNRVDPEGDIESSLKTGERAVTILPPLRRLLEDYLPTLSGRWLVPLPKGGRWNGDAFAKRLRSINAEADLKWTCLHYRHTYATQRAAEGWSLFRIAHEMGNSVAIVSQYYAAYLRPIEIGAPRQPADLHVLRAASA